MLSCLDSMVSIAVPYINLDRADIIKLDFDSTSKGNQSKYYDLTNKLYIKQQFEYNNIKWKDYMIEHLSYIIGSQMNTNINIIKQDIVKLSNGYMGCVSRDFAIDKRWIPIAKFSEYKNLVRLRGKSYRVFTGILDIYGKIGIPLSMVKEYLCCMIILDFLLGNEDRHYSNFGVLQDNNTLEYLLPPLFDFGLGLFEHDKKYIGIDLYSAKSMMDGKPFDTDLSKAFDMIINIMGLEYIKSMCKDITIPDKELFPNELGYQYFIDSYSYMRKVLRL